MNYSTWYINKGKLQLLAVYSSFTAVIAVKVKLSQCFN